MYKILDAVHSYCICTLVLKMNTNHETHQGQQTRYWEQRQAWQQLLNNIHQSQQLVDHWEMFVRVICFQLLTAVVLLLWETAFSSSHMHRERKMWCAKPLWEDCSIELIYLNGMENILFPSCWCCPSFSEQALAFQSAPLHHPCTQMWFRSCLRHANISVLSD